MTEPLLATTGTLLYDATIEWHLLAWLAGVPVLAAAWLLCMAVVGTGPGPRWQRALFPFGHAAIAVLGALVLIRTVQFLRPALGSGPQHWLVDRFPRQAVTGLVIPAWVHPYDTLLIVCFGASVIVFFVAPLAAILDRPRPERPPWLNGPLPGGTVASALLALAAVSLPFLFHLAYPHDTDHYVLLDLVGITPVLGLVLALRLQARLPTPRDDQAIVPAPQQEHAAPDVRGAWVAAGVLARDAVPLATARAEPVGAGAPSSRALAAWRAAEAPGEPPEALDRLLHGLGEKVAWLVGDLPLDTEEHLLASFLADAVGVQGRRVLGIVEDPQHLADRLAATLERVHVWTPGFVAVGAAALRESVARRRLPAVVLVDAADLADALIRIAAREAATWVAGLDTMLVHRPDAGTPLEVTHAAFTLRRWHLATAHLATPTVIATGADTPAVLGLLETLFPGRTPQRCPLGPRTTGPLTVLPAIADEAPAGDPWVLRAARAAIGAGAHPVPVLDPEGAWGALDGTARVEREVRFDGEATVAALSAPWLGPAWRAAAHRSVRRQGEAHHALWHVAPSPVARYLLAQGRLQTLTQRRELPSPKPVVGLRNRFLRMSHLRATVHDAATDELALRRSYGEDVVDFALRELESNGDHVARVEAGSVVRARVLRPPPGQERPEARRRTVTSRVVEIVEDRSGRVLDVVDDRLAPTRYYPKRVFAVGTRRYRVPLHAWDPKRAQIRVEPADPRDQITLPVLGFDLEVRGIAVERVTRREGALVVTTLTVDALIHEQVLAAWVPGGHQEERFDPVSTHYDGEVRVIFPDAASDGPGLFHLAATVNHLLPTVLRVDDEDCEAVPLGAGVVPGTGPGVALIDRHVGGMGIARALDEGTVVELLRLARAVLFECPCMDGCSRCTPEPVLRIGPAKQAVLKMLPG